MVQAGTRSSSEGAIQIFLDESSRLLIIMLLVDFFSAKKRWAEQKRQQLRDLLWSQLIQDLYQERFNRLMQSGERFDIFSALWLDRRENYLSRFIAYLLDLHCGWRQNVIILVSVSISISFGSG